MTKRVLFGMLTPSSNTALEPITTAMVAGLPEVSAHFSRFKVTEIALSSSALAQFDNGEILRAAELLAHAKVDAIGWNGTSSGWLGFEADVRLCEQITAATGIPATTSMLALNEILEQRSVQTKILETTASSGSPATASGVSACRTIFSSRRCRSRNWRR
jgi:maleate isomerase